MARFGLASQRSDSFRLARSVWRNATVSLLPRSHPYCGERDKREANVEQSCHAIHEAAQHTFEPMAAVVGIEDSLGQSPSGKAQQPCSNKADPQTAGLRDFA